MVNVIHLARKVGQERERVRRTSGLQGDKKKAHPPKQVSQVARCVGYAAYLSMPRG